MGNIMLEGMPVGEMGEADLLKWLHQFGQNKPADALKLWAGVLRAFDDIGSPMTVRQVFYALTVRGLIQKTENGYKQVAYRLLQMRHLGIVPYSFIADNTRWMRKPDTYASLGEFLNLTRDTYRRALWMEQPAYVEIWIEKDALAGVLTETTGKWDVPLMVTRGFPSESFVYEAAQNIKATGKPAYLYYFGDFDPSGMSISDSTQAKLAKLAPEAVFRRMAVTEEQIQSLRLPTRPTKRSDSRAKQWRGDSVELDAIPADVLRRMVEDCITQHVDRMALYRIQQTEALERQTLAAVLEGYDTAGTARNETNG